ncbi:MAG: hypothetical protein AAB495_03025 [Patescibacteria group bacterium]
MVNRIHEKHPGGFVLHLSNRNTSAPAAEISCRSSARRFASKLDPTPQASRSAKRNLPLDEG